MSNTSVKSPIRRVSSRGIDLIKTHEGFRARRYYDPAGLPTIGYGHLLRAHEDFPQPMTMDEAQALLAQDCEVIEIYLSAVFPRVNQNQFDALASFAYNLGIGALDKSTLKRKLQAGDVAGAAEEFTRWVYANQVMLPGLVTRRAAERVLFLTPDDGAENLDVAPHCLWAT
jgi:lysozyme